MSIFKEGNNNAGQNNNSAKKDDLFTVVNAKEQDDIDKELLESLMEDDSLTAPADEKRDVAENKPANDSDKNKGDKNDKSEKNDKQDKPEKNDKQDKNINVSEKKTEAKDIADVDNVTRITKGTTINGSINSDCSLDVMGTINGDIECLGKLTISGKVTGNSVAAEVFVNTDRLEGNITSEGCVKIGLGTVVLGDIIATSGVIAGAVKGEIDINGPVVLDSTAIIKGNVKAKSVQMNNGAVLEGFCSLTYAEVKIDNIFE